MPSDSKLFVYLNPARFLADTTTTFDPRLYAGWVPHQHIAYLWPMGPWFWFFDTIGVPDWIAHRLWVGTLLVAAGLGVRWVSRLFGLGPTAVLVAAIVYQLSPYILPYVSRTSILLLPYAGLGWIVGLTVLAARRGVHRTGGQRPGSADPRLGRSRLPGRLRAGPSRPRPGAGPGTAHRPGAVLDRIPPRGAHGRRGGAPGVLPAPLARHRGGPHRRRPARVPPPRAGLGEHARAGPAPAGRRRHPRLLPRRRPPPRPDPGPRRPGARAGRPAALPRRAGALPRRPAARPHHRPHRGPAAHAAPAPAVAALDARAHPAARTEPPAEAGRGADRRGAGGAPPAAHRHRHAAAAAGAPAQQVHRRQPNAGLCRRLPAVPRRRPRRAQHAHRLRAE